MNKCDVFISYKLEDSEPALEIQKKLEESSVSCYMASDKGFDDLGYSSQITEAIKDCKVFILVLSEKTQASQWIAKELDYAISINKTILPFLIEACTLRGDYKFYLSDVQHYQAFMDKESSLKKIGKDVIRIIDQPEKGEEVIDDNISLKKDRKKIINICFGIVLICFLSIVFMFSGETQKENELWKTEEPYSFVWGNNQRTKIVYAVCPVTNTSEGYIGLDLSSVSLKNKDGDILYDNLVSGNPQIIKPGGTGYYNTVLLYEEDNNTEFDIKSKLNIKKYDGDIFFLDTSDVAISDTAEGKIKVTGRIINTTHQEITRIYISVLLYDENNRLIANPSDQIFSQLSPGDTIGFSIQTAYAIPELTAEKVDHFDVDVFSYN